MILFFRHFPTASFLVLEIVWYTLSLFPSSPRTSKTALSSQWPAWRDHSPCTSTQTFWEEPSLSDQKVSIRCDTCCLSSRKMRGCLSVHACRPLFYTSERSCYLQTVPLSIFFMEAVTTPSAFLYRTSFFRFSFQTERAVLWSRALK